MNKNLLKISSAYIFTAFFLGGCSSSSSGSEEDKARQSETEICEVEETPIVMTAGEDHFIDLSSTSRIELVGNAISTIPSEEIVSYSWTNNDGLQISNKNEKQAYVIVGDNFSSDSTEFTLTVVDSLGNELTDTITYAVWNPGPASECEDEFERRTEQSIYRLGVNSLGNSDRDFSSISVNEGDQLDFYFDSSCRSPVPFESVSVSIRMSLNSQATLNGNIVELSNGVNSLSITFGNVDRNASATVSARYRYVDGSLQSEVFNISIENLD